MRQAPNAQARGFKVGRLGWSLISLLTLIALWEVAALIAQSRYLPGPLAVVQVMIREAEAGELWGNIAAVAAVAINKIPNVAVTTREGARSLSRDLAEMAEVYHFGRWKTLRHVTLPQLAPFFAAASRSGLALVWKIVLVVEAFGRSDGVGHQLNIAFQLFDVPMILSYALAFIVVVQVIELAILQPLIARANKWRR